MIDFKTLSKIFHTKEYRLEMGKIDDEAKDLISKIDFQSKTGRLEDTLIINAVDFLEKNKHLGKKERYNVDMLAGYLADCYAKNLMGPEGSESSEGKRRYEEHYFNCNKCFKKAADYYKLHKVIKVKGHEIFK